MGKGVSWEERVRENEIEKRGRELRQRRVSEKRKRETESAERGRGERNSEKDM